MFGGLLSQQSKDEEEEETDNGPDTEEEPSTMANILVNKSRLSGLQKSVCLHVMNSVHTEAVKMKEEWEASLEQGPGSPPKPPPPPRQISHDPGLESGSQTKGKGPDTYCYELLTMLGGLCQSELGCTFLAEQSQLVKDLLSFLHTATARIQLQV